LNEEIKQLTELQVIDLEIAKFDAEINAEKAELIKSEKGLPKRSAGSSRPNLPMTWAG
jgi:hypothetical protein